MTARARRPLRTPPGFPADVLPPGTRARARRLLESTLVLLGELTDSDATAGATRWQVDHDLLDAHLLLPHVIAASNGLDAPLPSPYPLSAPGGGWVLVDLGPDDEPTWATLRAVLDDEVRAGGPPSDAEQLARRAQEWRLAVTPYRPPRTVTSGPLRVAAADTDPTDPASTGAGTSPPARTAAGPPGQPQRFFGPGSSAPGRPLAGVRIIDLTAMWAGPLATWLAASSGAEVVKVEAACRRDGFRRGARPVAAGPGDGALFVALDHGKTHVELDLRLPADHQRFLELVGTADVVIDSFSRRVRANLGIAPDRLAGGRPDLIDLSLTAFDPAGPQADWVAYGAGVHAASGLALATRTTAAAPMPPAPTLVPYADPLAGLELFLAMVGALVARIRGVTGPWRIERSLEGAIAPLLAVAADERTAPSDPAERTAPTGPAERGRACAEEVASWAGHAAQRSVRRDGCAVLPPPWRLLDTDPEARP